MKLAMEKAEACGMGAVAVTNSQHFGAAGYHAQLALERDMIGVAMTQGGVYMLPTHGATPMLGVNPIGFAAPTREEAPFIFDASTSSVAVNKIILARRLGVNIPGGWIAKSEFDFLSLYTFCICWIVQQFVPEHSHILFDTRVDFPTKCGCLVCRPKGNSITVSAYFVRVIRINRKKVRVF